MTASSATACARRHGMREGQGYERAQNPPNTAHKDCERPSALARNDRYDAAESSPHSPRSVVRPGGSPRRRHGELAESSLRPRNDARVYRASRGSSGQDGPISRQTAGAGDRGECGHCSPLSCATIDSPSLTPPSQCVSDSSAHEVAPPAGPRRHHRDSATRLRAESGGR